MSNEKDDPKRVKPFAQWLQEQPTGLHGELSESLQEAVQACLEAPGKKAKMVLSVEVSMNGKGQVVVKDDVKVTKPKPDRGIGLFFADDEGNLDREDPRQQKLPLREVTPAEPITVRVNSATGEVVE